MRFASSMQAAPVQYFCSHQVRRKGLTLRGVPAYIFHIGGAGSPQGMPSRCWKCGGLTAGGYGGSVIRDEVANMNKKQRAILIVAAVFLILNGIYLPWKVRVVTPLYQRSEFIGYRCLFAPPLRPEGTETVDIQRTQFAIQLITLLVTTTVLVLAFKDRPAKDQGVGPSVKTDSPCSTETRSGEGV